MSDKPKTVEAKLKWYDLARIVPYRDGLLVLGATLVVSGVAMIYIPAALIVAGGGLVWLSSKLAE